MSVLEVSNKFIFPSLNFSIFIIIISFKYLTNLNKDGFKEIIPLSIFLRDDLMDFNVVKYTPSAEVLKKFKVNQVLLLLQQFMALLVQFF